MIKIFGIRHHGPGSAKSLRKGLQDMQPDLILIEGPPSADKLIRYVSNEGLKPPVALLIYNPKELSQASYFPFAEFSPEWQAMKHAVLNDIPVKFMDLPQAYHFTLNKQEAEETQLALQKIESRETIDIRLSEEEKLLRKDPLAYAARLSGYQDSERWWEVMFEKDENEAAIFTGIIELMTALRERVTEPPRRELMREAFMRNTIRKAMKEGFEHIAVICGAWHAPVLQNTEKHKASTDNAILRGIKKTSTKATWVPWSYDRLSTFSGYRSGVISPAYYELLFRNRKEVVTRWMAKVARLFRKEDLDASSAHIIEAIRLANTLAALRNLSLPGIDELYESAVSIFCEGYDSRMDIIQKKLIIGDRMGKVPPEIPMIPLQQDLEKTVKSARLSKERNSTEVFDKKLDLRKPTNLTASHLLHRLNLLGIPWGEQKKNSRFNTGNFSEVWKLQWKPDFAIHLIEAGMWGNTVYNAATNYIQHEANKVDTLPALTALVETALNANLSEAVALLIHYLEDLSALTKDVLHLMEALPALVNAIRYGSTRKLDIAALETVINQMIPRICISLPNACMAMDEEASKALFEKLLSVNQCINILNQAAYRQDWYGALEKIINFEQINGLLKGACTRILFDKEVFSVQKTGTLMRFALSKGSNSSDAALWVEGFLHGSALLLIHNPMLWKILDDWVSELKPETFQELLPLLRRTFSAFSHPERQKMMQLVKGEQQMIDSRRKAEEEDTYVTALGEKVIPTVKLLLGLD